MFLVFYLSFLVLAALTSLYYLVRINRVFNMRQRVLDQLSEAANDDISKDLSWMWRYDAFRTVSFDSMVWSFSKLKPENYWADLGFLYPVVTKKKEKK